MSNGRSTVDTIVLVHGGWHGSWAWERLLPPRAERKLEVRTVDLPSCGNDTRVLGDLRDDAEAVRRAVREAGGDGALILPRAAGPGRRPPCGPGLTLCGLRG
jgi:pimeloyl-ACP methyl ester carboxylesterase